MDFTFSDDQEQLRRVVRQLGTTPPDDGASLWRAVTQQLGLTGIGIAPERGGAGGDFVDAAVVVEEVGRTLLPAPVTTSLVAGAILERAGEAAADVVAAVAAGDRIAVVGVTEALAAETVAADGSLLTGRVDHVLDGDRADLLLLATGNALWLVDLPATGVAVAASLTLDASRGQASVHLDGAGARRLGGADDARVAVDLLRVALSVEAVGAARHCLDLTVAHLKTREQFGRPIGSFQALQHRVADLVVDVESAVSTAYYAAWAAAHAPKELGIVAPLAKAVCADAAWRVAAETIQMHGGIGFTWEHDAHRYFKRLTTTRLLLGDAHVQRQLVAERAAIGPAAIGPASTGPAATGTAPVGR